MSSIKEIQQELQRRGLYLAAVDGIIGDKTISAICAALGIGETRPLWWDEIQFFRYDEKNISCPCCGYNNMEEQTMKAADELRRIVGVPVSVSSGTRCTAHNKGVGGAANSKHLRGLALDISGRGLSSKEMLEAAAKVPAITYAYAIDSTHIHINL